MITAEQLKGKIRNFSTQTKLPPQELLQMYLFERVLTRLSLSPYSKNFILKGGLLISSMIGIAERSTMDMDVTVTGINMDFQTITDIVKEILAMDTGDGFIFEFKKIEQIREDDDYFNFRIHFNAIAGKINNPMKLDITTGDIITPMAVDYSYKSLFDNDLIPILAYNPETVVAEKYETILRRNITNTRARDFYDLFKFFRLFKDRLNKETLKAAVTNTARKRNSLEEINDAQEIINEIGQEEYIINLWNNYSSKNNYAKNISFNEIISNLWEIEEYIRG